MKIFIKSHDMIDSPILFASTLREMMGKKNKIKKNKQLFI